MARTAPEFSVVKKYQLWLLGFVAILTILSANAAWIFPTRSELDTEVYLLHRTIALDMRNQLTAFLSQYEKSLIDGADVINQSIEGTQYVVSRLMKENQPFESVTLLDTSGKEVFKNHRFLLVSSSDLRDRSGENLFKTITENKIYISSVSLSGFSEPLITIAVPLTKNSGFSAISADINLKFLSDVVRSASPENKEEVAYIVDQQGYIIAHSNQSLVFGRENIINRKIILEALNGMEANTENPDFRYKNEVNEEMFAVVLPFDLTGWVVAIEVPDSIAHEASNRVFNLAIISLVLEILMVVLLIWNYMNLIKSATLFFRERNQREAILNSLYDGVIEYDENSTIILMNPKAEEILGISFHEIEGLRISPDLIKTRPELTALVELIYPAVAPYASATKQLAGSPARAMEIHISRPELKLLVTMTQVLDKEGRVKEFLKIIHDVSRERLVSKLKSEFVSIAAHQLRTPLSAIKWTLKLLLEGDAGPLSASQLEFLEKGYTINERMIKLVNDLLNAARIEEGKFGYEFKKMDINVFAKEIFTNYETSAKSKSLIYTFEQPDEEVPPIYADSEKLSLALTNIIENAIKYTPNGGKVAVSLKKEGEFAKITVFDNGIAVPEAEKSRVFSKFFRASNVVRLETEGTGLGLFISYNIIKRHGGKLTFDSGKDGTSFIFTLPLRQQDVPLQEVPELNEFLESI
ncbi:MAG: ATP-binding protein [bacterium]|nr:ATP-binding protein [bacterium]